MKKYREDTPHVRNLKNGLDKNNSDNIYKNYINHNNTCVTTTISDKETIENIRQAIIDTIEKSL